MQQAVFFARRRPESLFLATVVGKAVMGEQAGTERQVVAN
jgi:hypothetical protein